MKSYRSKMPRPLVRLAALLMSALVVSNSAHAAFHLWTIREIYSNSSGTLQFIEFFTASSSQQFVGGQQVQVSNIGASQTHTFTIPTSFAGDSGNHAFLMGTAGLQAAGGPAPDFIMPDGFLFTAGGSINFFGANSGPYTAMPTDGILSRTWTGGNAPNTPQNFAGQIGFIPEPSTAMLLGIGALGGILAFRRRIKV